MMVGPMELGMMRQRYDGYGMFGKRCGNCRRTVSARCCY